MSAKPGVCGICGCAVVRMHPEEHGASRDVDGHIYKGGALVRVRCSRHTESMDSSPEADAHGGHIPRYGSQPSHGLFD